LGIGTTTPASALDVKGSVNANGFSIGGVDLLSQLLKTVNVQNASAYSPYTLTTAAQGYTSSTFNGAPGSGAPWVSASYLINATNYAQNSINGNYLIYNVPTGMSYVFINCIAAPSANTYQVFGYKGTSYVLLSTIINGSVVYNGPSASAIDIVYVADYSSIKIQPQGWMGIQGLGWK
jgi:hypothetical protein